MASGQVGVVRGRKERDTDSAPLMLITIAAHKSLGVFGVTRNAAKQMANHFTPPLTSRSW
jgi:hypothetical protein